MKIIDKMQQQIDNGKTFFSFEFFPPRTDEGVANLFDRQDRMAAYGPTFCDITWGAGGSTADLTLDIAAKMQNLICVETMMHVTCTNMPEEKLSSALAKLKEHGIRNVLALRGDPPKGQDSFVQVEGGFACALDLVKYIRREHGDYFGIAVAGYPEAHPDAISQDAQEQDAAYWKDIHYLKEKVDAGSDFVVTQLFYDVDIYLKFVEDCRSVGIEVPIIPGIMPIMTYGGFKRMTGFCKTKIPAEVSEALEAIKDNDEAVKAFGIQHATDMCKRILAAGIPGLHLYTLNLERSAIAILENLEIIPRVKTRSLPWRQPANGKRTGESVRPVFWANRPAAYIKRTSDWDQYPSGRWGNAKSPAYGTLNDYQFMRRHTSNEQRLGKAKAAWGADLTSVEDVVNVFVKYTSGKIDVLPWTELEGLHAESATIAPQLVDINRKGYLTINSQPQVNAAASADPKVGWGGPDGYVYQKAYIEFFVSPEKFKTLQAAISKQPSLTYMAVTSKGDYHSNQASASVNAVTWGVFPGSEIVQPTVVDQESFLVWKDEAFSLWETEWASIYKDGSTGHQIIQNIVDCWYLVSVVENDYIKGDLFRVFSTS